MKKIVQTIIAATALLFVGCTDKFTDLTPQGSITEANFWKTAADAEKGVNAMYYYMGDEDMFGRGFMWYIHASDDMVTGRDNGKAARIKNFGLSASNGYAKWMYPQSFKIIARANDVLRHVPEIEMDEKLKNRCLGEALFMRSFHYFWLASTYGNDISGGIPIVTEENLNSIKFERPESVVENYAQIVKDLTKAAELLPLSTEYSDENKGRPHKDACYAYAAKTYLYWAQYDNSKWSEVITFCDKVTHSGSGRALINTGSPETDFKDVFKYENEFGSEYIWSVNSGTERGSKLCGVMLENKGWGKYNGWGYYMPTEELYNEFEAGDHRREATILKFGDEFTFFGETMKYASQNSLSGFQFNKYMDIYKYPLEDGLINPDGDRLYTAQDVPILRYAEILLMKAEAKIQQGQNGDFEINQVRERAGLPAKNGCTIDDLKHERRVEFAGEFANRHRDLVRWGDAQSVYAKPLHGREHSDKSDPNSSYTVKEIWPARNYNPEVHNVWIIPDEVIQSSGIPQNKGW